MDRLWLGRSQQQLIEYQREEIQLLRQKLGGDDFRFKDGIGDDWRCWGGSSTQGSWSGCHGGDARYDPALYRELVAKKYDGSAKRGPGRPGTVTGVIRLLVRMARENRVGAIRAAWSAQT